MVEGVITRITGGEVVENDDLDDLDPDDECLWCGGDGFTESNDPLWDGWDEDGNPNLIPCPSCHGSGLKKDMTCC